VGKGTTLGHRRVDKRQPNPESTTKTRATLTRPHTKPVHGPTPATRRAFPKRPDPLGSHQYTGLRRPQGELSPSGRILWYTIATRYATAALPKSTRHRLTLRCKRQLYTHPRTLGLPPTRSRDYRRGTTAEGVWKMALMTLTDALPALWTALSAASATCRRFAQ
jgi:hypothetical protein